MTNLKLHSRNTRTEFVRNINNIITQNSTKSASEPDASYESTRNRMMDTIDRIEESIKEVHTLLPPIDAEEMKQCQKHLICAAKCNTPYANYLTAIVKDIAFNTSPS